MGRKSIETEMRIAITGVLKALGMATTDRLRIEISKKFNRKISWNTVNKYLQMLIEEKKADTFKSEPSREDHKEGRTFYFIGHPKLRPLKYQS